jgi:hypothetical protein
VKKLCYTLALVFAPASSFAASLPAYGVFTYSDLCWEQASGDAAGTRFALTRTHKKVSLRYEYGNGPLEEAQIKSLRVTGDHLEAQASTNDGGLSINARLGPRSAILQGIFDFEKDHPPGAGEYKRIKRFSQKIPDCR